MGGNPFYENISPLSRQQQTGLHISLYNIFVVMLLEIMVTERTDRSQHALVLLILLIDGLANNSLFVVIRRNYFQDKKSYLKNVLCIFSVLDVMIL
jgi:hypothetical protein